jgi:L-threonylcarbamoyladenylate synthase
VLACADTPAFVLRWVQAPADAAGFAHDLYARLRELDKLGAQRILVERVPEEPEWDAVRDRLQRASAGH